MIHTIRFYFFRFVFILVFCISYTKAQNLSAVAFNNSSINKNYTIANSYFQAEKIAIDKESKKAKRMKITGLVFTSLGVAGILTTTPFVVISKRINDHSNLGNLAAAMISIIGYTPSAACLSVGLPLTIVGYKKAKKQAVALETTSKL